MPREDDEFDLGVALEAKIGAEEAVCITRGKIKRPTRRTPTLRENVKENEARCQGQSFLQGRNYSHHRASVIVCFE